MAITVTCNKYNNCTFLSTTVAFNATQAVKCTPNHLQLAKVENVVVFAVIAHWNFMEGDDARFTQEIVSG